MRLITWFVLYLKHPLFHFLTFTFLESFQHNETFYNDDYRLLAYLDSLMLLLGTYAWLDGPCWICPFTFYKDENVI